MSDVEAATNIVRFMLRPVQPLLDQPGLTDLHINGVGRAFYDVGFGMKPIDLPYNLRDLENLALYAAAITRQDISEATPIVSTKFPDGERVNIILPPAVEDGSIAFSLRKPMANVPTPDKLKDSTFENAKHGESYVSSADKELRRLYKDGNTKELLKLAVISGLNIVFSGSVGTGKTFLMRSYINYIPPERRIITVEDTRELINMSQPNVVHLLYSKGEQSVAKVTAEELIECSMRLGMDFLINQELRDGGGAYAYADALSTGHKICTSVHSDSAEDTRNRIRGLVKKHPAGRHMDSYEITAALHRDIDLIVHCQKEKDPVTGEWRRFIDEVLYDPDAREKYAAVPSPFKGKAA